MTRRIDTQAEIDNIRLTEQAGDIVAVNAGYWHIYAKEGGLYVEDDNEVVGGPIGTALEPGGRLTLTSATPVTTADVNNATTVYYTPYKHNMISLYDGARWIPVPFTEKSLAVGAYTASKPYDIFGYLSSGTLALESTVWTDGTTRATALAYQNGRYVKSGTATRLYLGTIYIDGDQKTDDSVLKRFVWNYYNRLQRNLYTSDATSHSYTTSSWRSWNNDANIRFECMIGVLEAPVIISINSTLESSYSGIGLDATNSNATPLVYRYNLDSVLDTAGASGPVWPAAAGYHYFQAVELGLGGATEENIYIGAVING